MLILRFIAFLVVVIQTIFGAGAVAAQGYPNKPIRFMTPSVGGSPDTLIRQVGPELTAIWGQPVVIENGSGRGKGEIFARATPDGYNLLINGNTFWIGPLMLAKPLYDVVKDFSPVTLTGNSPNILVVHPSVPANSVKELITLAKSKPGAINYGSGSTASSNHFAAELFNLMAGIDMVRIQYRGAGQMVAGGIGGEVQVVFPTAGAAIPHVKSGRLRALAVTSAQPSMLTPGLPTVAASGLPGYESGGTTGILAPAKTPTVIIRQLNNEIVRILNRPEMKQKLLTVGIEVIGSSPESFATTIKSDITTMGKLIKDIGIQSE